MINVYDWFESFQLALEKQRERLNKMMIKRGSRH